MNHLAYHWTVPGWVHCNCPVTQDHDAASSQLIPLS